MIILILHLLLKCFVVFFSIALSTHTSNNGASHTVKKVQKNFNNYASVECGAKILGSNPEAKVHMILCFSCILQRILLELDIMKNKKWY